MKQPKVMIIKPAEGVYKLSVLVSSIELEMFDTGAYNAVAYKSDFGIFILNIDSKVPATIAPAEDDMVRMELTVDTQHDLDTDTIGFMNIVNSNVTNPDFDYCMFMYRPHHPAVVNVSPFFRKAVAHYSRGHYGRVTLRYRKAFGSQYEQFKAQLGYIRKPVLRIHLGEQEFFDLPIEDYKVTQHKLVMKIHLVGIDGQLFYNSHLQGHKADNPITLEDIELLKG